MSRLLFRFRVAAAVAGAVLAAAMPAGAATSGKDALAQLNKDGDDTLEIVEVIDLGTQMFKVVNADGDTTLRAVEAEGRVTPEDWTLVNKDGDQTLELDEWLVIVRSRFNAADANKDGKLTAAELDSPAGQKLLLLLVK
ncbi:hypothetical protein [Xanthobacter sediminis]